MNLVPEKLRGTEAPEMCACLKDSMPGLDASDQRKFSSCTWFVQGENFNSGMRARCNWSFIMICKTEIVKHAQLSIGFLSYGRLSTGTQNLLHNIP